MKNRLKKRKDIEAVFKQGRGFKDNFLALKAVSNNLQASRFGLVVSQKVSKKAVVRNKVRRRLGEIVRGKGEEIRGGLDIVLVALPGIEKMSFLETKELVINLLKKCSVL